MTAQTKAPPVAAGRGWIAEPIAKQAPGHCSSTRRQPPYARRFKPRQAQARVIIGWPGAEIADCCLVLPTDESPRAFDWRVLRGLHVFVQPPPGCHAPADVLRDLGAELVAAGVSSLILFDGSDCLAEFWRAADERPRGVA
jgi:hypothetical protein